MNMRYLILFVVLAIMAGCGHSQVCREKTVYVSEINFLEQAAIQQATALQWFVKHHCKCEDGMFITEECREAARLVIVVETRIPWHKAMMFYNAGITENRPSENPPAILPSGTLCSE